MNRRLYTQWIAFILCCTLAAGPVYSQSPTSAYSVTSSMSDMDGFYTFNNQTFNGKPVFKHVTKSYFLYYGSYAGQWMEWQLGARVANWDAPWTCCYYFSNNNVTGNFNDVSYLGASAVVQESSLLDVKFLSFEVSLSSGQANLQWSVSDDQDALTYEIEKSFDGLHFGIIESLPADRGAGLQHKYLFKDPAMITGTVYYRIRSSDKAGRVNYSPVKIAQPDAKELVILSYPNPVTSMYYIRSTGGNPFTCEILSASATVVFSSPFFTSSLSVPVSHLARGTYIVRLNMQDGSVRVARFLKL